MLPMCFVRECINCGLRLFEICLIPFISHAKYHNWSVFFKEDMLPDEGQQRRHSIEICYWVTQVTLNYRSGPNLHDKMILF